MCGFYGRACKLRTNPPTAATPPLPLMVWNTSHRRIAVIDIVYVLAIVAFFALMLLYVRACERLGRNAEDPTERSA